MKKSLPLLAAAICLAAPAAFAQIPNPVQQVENAVEGELHPNDATIVQGRQQVREVARESLASLYEVAPGARRAIERSAGYAVFSTFGIKLFFAGGTSGKGMVVNNRTSRETFMRMVQVQGGLGLGIAQNRLIFVFTTQDALNNFLNQGWEFGAQANVSAMAGDQGGMFTGAASIAPGVYLYQLTQNGLSATLTVAGTKFFKDPQL
jgi:lipid-binding SYLF domain-containing protein